MRNRTGSERDENNEFQYSRLELRNEMKAGNRRGKGRLWKGQ